jgi:hypothetical protein
MGEGRVRVFYGNPITLGQKTAHSLNLDAIALASPPRQSHLGFWWLKTNQNVVASRSLAKQSPVKREKLTFWRLLQAEKHRLRNDIVILGGYFLKCDCPGLAPEPPHLKLHTSKTMYNLQKGLYRKTQSIL